mgnify:CR=1 FL=1
MTTSNDIPLASHPVDRAAHHRTDTAWPEAAILRDDVLVFLMQKGAPLVQMSGQNLVWLGPEFSRLPGLEESVFLGVDKAGAPVFAVNMGPSFKLEGSLLQGAGEFTDMRAAASGLSPMEANFAATARSLLEWHRSHRFCSKCGAESEPTEAGWKRVCASCGAEHFPRTDPVALMLAVKDDKCLLGRQADPAKAEYLFCQPWPFPSSLMVGIIVEAETTEVSVAQDELEAARWITREEARQVLAGTHPDIYAPPPMAVAHHILKTWAERD